MPVDKIIKIRRNIMATVFPVKDIDFKISLRGRFPNSDNCFWKIRGMESFTISFDNGIDEWNPLDAQGWASRMVTSKSLTISLAGKRVVNCEGNDYIAGFAYLSGEQAQTTIQVTFPNGDILFMPCIINVTACGGGSAGDVAVLEFDCLSDGPPFFVKANAGSFNAAVANTVDITEVEANVSN
jgi:hypothetical protein